MVNPNAHEEIKWKLDAWYLFHSGPVFSEPIKDINPDNMITRLGALLSLFSQLEKILLYLWLENGGWNWLKKKKNKKQTQL